MPDTLLTAPKLMTKTDPARFEVVKNALYSAAEEMKIVLAKTAIRHCSRSRATIRAGSSMHVGIWWRKGRTCQSISARCRMQCAP